MIKNYIGAFAMFTVFALTLGANGGMENSTDNMWIAGFIIGLGLFAYIAYQYHKRKP